MNQFFWSAKSTKSLSHISSRLRKRKVRAGGALAWSSQGNQASVCTSCRLESPLLTIVFVTPNPGKSCFLYYLLFHLLSMGKSVAFQVGDKFLLFQDTGVRLCDITFSNGQIIPDGTWALADSHRHFDEPCDAFLNACKSGRAWVVQTTPPLEDKWRSWQKEYGADMYWMDVVTLDQLNALG